MPIRQLDSKQTFAEMKTDPQGVVIDVRTVEEFMEGHPQHAKNIPIFLLDARTGQKFPNSDFDAVIQKHVAKDQTVYLSCRSGQRSMMAAMRMEALGYHNLVNVKGGFAGNESTAGWKDSGLPVAEDPGADVSYASLLKSSKASP